MKGFSAAVLLWLLSCSPQPNRNTPSAREPQWEGLMLTWNNRSVSLDTNRDTLFLFESDRDSADPTLGKHQTLFVERAAQDSIWMIARRLMRTPSIREEGVTDYGGDFLRVKFYAQGLGTTQSLEYSSQEGWPREGDLGSLRELTFNRFKRNHPQ